MDLHMTGFLRFLQSGTNLTRKDLIKFQHATGYIRDNFKDHLPTIAELPQDIKNDFNQRGHIIASIKEK